MEEIIKIIGIGLIGLILIIIIKQYRPEFAIYISLITGALILYLAIDELSNVINLLKQICDKSGINNKFLMILIKKKCWTRMALVFIKIMLSTLELDMRRSMAS